MKLMADEAAATKPDAASMTAGRAPAASDPNSDSESDAESSGAESTSDSGSVAGSEPSASATKPQKKKKKRKRKATIVDKVRQIVGVYIPIPFLVPCSFTKPLSTSIARRFAGSECDC